MPLTDIRSIILPYCLKLQPCGRYVVLNREYKPLGFTSRKLVKYSDYPILLTFRMTARLAVSLSYKGSDDVRAVYLYGDGCMPLISPELWVSYQNRYYKLLKIGIPEGFQEEGSVRGRSVRMKNLRDASRLAL